MLLRLWIKLLQGFVIRDHHARVLRAGGKPLPSSSVPYAELQAAKLGSYVALEEVGASQVGLESNSATIVN